MQIGQVIIYGVGLPQDQISQYYNFIKNNYPNGYDGNINGAAFNPEGSFEFQSNDYLRFPTSAPFNESNTIKAITAWFKLDTSTSRVFIFNVSSTSNSNDYFYCSVIGDGTPTLGIFTRDGSSSNQSYTSASLTPDTNWHHVVYQNGTSANEIWLDGVKQTVTHSNSGTGANNSWISYPSYAASVVGELGRLRAASPSATHYSDGKISKVKLYDKALTQAEITALHSEGQ